MATMNVSAGAALRPRTPHALSHSTLAQPLPRLARLNSTTPSSTGHAPHHQQHQQPPPNANKRTDSGVASQCSDHHDYAHSASIMSFSNSFNGVHATGNPSAPSRHASSHLHQGGNNKRYAIGTSSGSTSTAKPQHSHFPFAADYQPQHRDHAADMSFLVHPADMTLSSIQLPNHNSNTAGNSGTNNNHNHNYGGPTTNGTIHRSLTPAFVSSRAPGQHTSGSLLTPMPVMPNLDDVWSTVSMIQSEILDDDGDLEHVQFGAGGTGGNGENGGLLPPSSSYVVSVAHEVLVRPEETSMEMCFADLGRHVSRLVKMQDLILALLEYNASKGRTAADASPLAIESIADKLLAVINEILYTTRPQSATRVRYMRAELATDRPFAVFAMFAKLADKFDDQRMSVLLAKLPFSLAEWVQLRNQVVVITERVRCAQEIHL
ncbi:hypothetical protein BCR44DRAFT_354956 [Catenaria anguillulae PL171]|uniref:Uncharacterized protein n=1 Tax=Catenaria anguillulae PL171 TaxID=765915 RepID=A0A1Y2HD98_9FUNG|nr:hypothetical protein BCR44DRAFT_354956 [Catenaria anguillulae PL171]